MPNHNFISVGVYLVRIAIGMNFILLDRANLLVVGCFVPDVAFPELHSTADNMLKPKFIFHWTAKKKMKTK